MAKYETDRAIVRLAKEVDNESIFRLCDEIDLAVDYYKYSEIEIQIDSPGGRIDSLDYYLTKLEGWRRAGISIATLAMTQASSAAAIILALGDIGRRRAYPTARILFHRARVQQIPTATADNLTQMVQSMSTLDTRIENLISQHILTIPALKVAAGATYPSRSLAASVEAKTYPEKLRTEDVCDALGRLQRMDQQISPDDALAMFLIDSIEY